MLDLSRPLEEIEIRIDSRQDGERLDKALGFFLTWRSRTSIQGLIEQGLVEHRGGAARAGAKVQAGDLVRVRIPKRPEPLPVEAPPGDEKITILHEDRQLIVLDKPAGLAVHPAGRRVEGTLIHWLHRRYRRPGDPAHDVVPRLLHRIDRETSGVVCASLDEDFHGKVGRLFEDRFVQKTYLAVVHGAPPQEEGIVDLGIGEATGSAIHLKMEARRDGSGWPALTRYRVVRKNARYALVELAPKTGRQHQIRVHMHALGCPLVGDKVYGVPESVFFEHLRNAISAESKELLVLPRHALHAHKIAFQNPLSGAALEFAAPLPGDLAELL
jgi:23S rRNA pseudouridine1911/1915/1917 synthase